jgi:site-specific recombinase
MNKEGLIKLLNEKKELKERTARVYDQIVGQIALLEDLIKGMEEVKTETKE